MQSNNLDSGGLQEDTIDFDTIKGINVKLGGYSEYLDHGFVGVTDVYGNELTIVRNARVSHGSGVYTSEKKNKDLLRYLVEHGHTSPLEQCSISYHVRAPLYIIAQHVRHRTARQNHQSLRYTQHDGLFFTPTRDDVRGGHSHNKQGSGDLLPEGVQDALIENVFMDSQAYARRKYELAIGAGCSKEIARTVLPVSSYSVILTQHDISNLLKYIQLRDHPHAQKQIQELAKIFSLSVKEHFPNVHDAFLEFLQYSCKFSRTETALLRQLIAQLTGDNPEKLTEALTKATEIVEGTTGNTILGSSRRMLDFVEKIKCS